MRANKSLCTYNGPHIFASISFFPSRNFILVLGGGVVWPGGGGSARSPPTPRVDKQNPAALPAVPTRALADAPGKSSGKQQHPSAVSHEQRLPTRVICALVCTKRRGLCRAGIRRFGYPPPPRSCVRVAPRHRARRPVPCPYGPGAARVRRSRARPWSCAAARGSLLLGRWSRRGRARQNRRGALTIPRSGRTHAHRATPRPGRALRRGAGWALAALWERGVALFSVFTLGRPEVIGGRIRLTDGGWHSTDGGWHSTDVGWHSTDGRCWQMTNRSRSPAGALRRPECSGGRPLCFVGWRGSGA